jgi:hypothetical protein
MTPFEMAARVAAFAWYSNHGRVPRATSQAQAWRFSQENWPVFLPAVNKGWGRLLLRLAQARSTTRRLSIAGNRSRKQRLSIAVEQPETSKRGGAVMYHTIEFAEDLLIDLEISPKHRLERMLVRRGTRLQAQLKPYVVETQAGGVEVADLSFADGTTTRRVPFAWFSFVD